MIFNIKLIRLEFLDSYPSYWLQHEAWEGYVWSRSSKARCRRTKRVLCN